MQQQECGVRMQEMHDELMKNVIDSSKTKLSMTFCLKRLTEIVWSYMGYVETHTHYISSDSKWSYGRGQNLL